MNLPWKLPLSLFSIAAVPTMLVAQVATTSLRGSVHDPSGAVIPGATITLVNQANGQQFSVRSSPAGDYQLAQLPPATYTISVAAAGFGTATRTADLLVNQPSTINFAMGVQGSTQQVNVTAAAETLNTTNASLGDAYSNKTIQALPSETRNVPDLLSLEPGVFFLPVPPASSPGEQDSRSGAVNGGRSDQGNITMDGIDDNDQVRGLAFTGVLRETQDSVEEFRTTTGDADADAGRSSGAQVSMITKSGTNQFHGAAYEYNRPTITVANDFFNKQAELNSGLPNIPGKLIRNIFGADLGGPIRKDKLFFFFNYEGTRRAENAQVTETTPTASYQLGNIEYTGDTSTGSTQTDTLTVAQVAALDSGCQVCNTAAYPYGPGPDPNALAYFNSMPAANGVNEGDGLNTGSYSFSSPNPETENTSILRLDWDPTPRQQIFGRGNLQKDTNAAVEQFPGQGPSSLLIDNSKGMAFGDTWTITPSIVNDLRYGYVRQGYATTGVGTGDYVDFRFLSTTTAETRSTINTVPVNEIVDTLSVSKGTHSIQLGGSWRLVDQNRSSNSNSFDSASSNPYWLSGNAPSPASLGMDPVDSGFTNSFNIAYANLIGTVPDVTDIYNYTVNSAASGSLLGDGAFINRRFRANEFEYYLQDSWRARPNLTLTYGIRHTLLQTPYETQGQQVAPTIDTDAWYRQRESSALAGQVYEPDLEFAPNGPRYGRPGYWPKAKLDLAPRVAFAYSPDAKTSIRGGFGIYFDHYGEALVNTFDQNGSFGLSTSVSSQAGVLGYQNSPRFINRRSIPFDNGTPPPTTSFPYTYPQGSFAITWGIDNRLKTPYSEDIDFSVQRELGHGFTLETDYVGRLGRHLLQSLDLAEPVDYTDPQGGGDYYNAGTELSREVDANGGNPNVNINPIQYFEDVFPYMANLDYAGESATQAIYTNEWAPYRANLGATTALADIDFYCVYGCPANHVPRFWQNQFASLYALATIGMSYYNAGQITLRHPFRHGIQTNVSYTYSRSIDMGSDAERSSEFSNGVAVAASDILNTWRPYLNRAVSDFDTTHLLTAEFVSQLPVGKGRRYLATTGELADLVLGGWQLSGILRATSGLPFSLFEPGWTTDWQIESYGVVTGKVKTHRHFDANGNPQYFQNPAAINAGVATGGPVRLPYPGEAGERNFFRGDGYFDLDSSLDKTWQIHASQTVQFTWEVYNVTNTVRFDPQSIGSGLTGGNLGVASAELTIPRRMQFSLRYAF